MRLCIMPLIESQWWGGSEEYWYQVAREALAQHLPVLIVVEYTGKLHKKYEELQSLGAELYKHRRNVNESIPTRLAGKLSRTVKNYPKAPTDYIKLLNKVHQFHPDGLLINQGGTFNVMEYPDYMWLIQQTDTPVFLFSHCYTEHKVYPDSYRERIKKLLQRVQKLYFISERNMITAQRAIASKDFTNTEVLRNLCKLQVKAPLPLPATATIHFANVARLHCRNKGQDILLEVLAGEPWRKRDWILHLYGEGEDKAYLQDLIQYYNLGDKVVLEGFSTDVIQLWQHHHLLLLPSLEEGTPQAIIEAMLCGRVGVVTDVGDSAALIGDGERGFVAGAPTAKLFGEALERAWQNRERWGEMGVKAHAFIQHYIDPSPGATLLQKMIQEVALLKK